MRNIKWATREVQVRCYDYFVLREIITTWEWGRISNLHGAMALAEL